MDCPPAAEGEGSAHSVLGETGRPDRTDAVRFHLGRHTHLDKEEPWFPGTQGGAAGPEFQLGAMGNSGAGQW